MDCGHAVFRIRHTCRFTARSTVRCASRAAFRVRWRSPDDLGAALTAYGRALHAQRRLARLAPRFFDSVVIERERRQREERRRWMALWEPALARAYGCSPPPYKPEDDLPPLPPLSTQQTVERQLACWDLWFNLGREALRRYQQRRPHELVAFGRLARLLEIAIDFKRMATGFDPALPNSEPANTDTAWADLKRAYGHRCDSAPPRPASPPAPAARESSPAPGFRPVQAVPAAPSGDIPPANDTPRPSPADLVACLVAPPPLGHYRRDAWSSWARHVRRLTG